MKNVEIKGKNSQDQEVTVIVKAPTAKQRTDSRIKESAAFARAMQDGVMPRVSLNNYLERLGLWDKEKEEKTKDLRKKLIEGEAQLNRGARTKDGQIFTKTQGKQLALDMQAWRQEYLNIRSVLNQNDQATSEAIADDERFRYLCSVCIYNEDGTQHFKDLNDYMNRENEPYVQEAAAELAKITNGYDPKWYAKLPEIAFLIKYKFMDEDYSFLNENGQKVDSDGKPVDKNGNYLNSDGKPINEFGDEIDDNGNVIGYVEFE